MKPIVMKKINNFIEYLKTNKKRIIIYYIIFFSIFTIFLIIDQTTKSTLFKHGSVIHDTRLEGGVLFVKNPFYKDIIDIPKTGPQYVLPEEILPIDPSQWINHSIIGVRSIWHKGVTFLPDNINIDFIQAVSMIIFLLTLLVPLMAKNKILVITISIISAGAMGNMLDRFIFAGYVKDLFYWPFLESKMRSTGTFNFADVSVIVGAVATIITLLAEFLYDITKNWKNKKNKNSENYS